MKLVYHGVPKDMVGETIYPLNQLKQIAPSAYELQKSKYVGRETVLDFRIPGLNVLFNDTVHCAALDPRRLLDVRQQLGLAVPGAGMSDRITGRFYAIPMERILIHRVIWYSARTLWINGAPGEDVPSTPPSDEFEPFDPDIYQERMEATPAHLAFLRRMKSAGKPPLMFVHIPHILVAGPIDVNGLDQLEWQGGRSIADAAM